jgi:hypothetical protein
MHDTVKAVRTKVETYSRSTVTQSIVVMVHQMLGDLFCATGIGRDEHFKFLF